MGPLYFTAVLKSGAKVRRVCSDYEALEDRIAVTDTLGATYEYFLEQMIFGSVVDYPVMNEGSIKWMYENSKEATA